MTLLKLLLAIFFLSGLFILLMGTQFWKDFLSLDVTPGSYVMDPHDPNGGLIEIHGDVALFFSYSSPFLETVNITTEEEILKILDGDISDIDPNDIGHLYIKLGSLKSQNYPKESLKYYKKAVNIFIGNEEYFYAANTSRSIAYSLHELGDKEEAIAEYQKSAEQFLLANAKNHADFVREIASRIKIRMQTDAGKEASVVVELEFPNSE
ncbi:MAG: tetratricopeptide repeat protein [Emcibacteraceae bacterium]|nr:tetratricopeptide repeat protein [Emcibacteraceae bacterium]MDG1725846.1 tetratricopeptide repeat protein [Emcibacteraceae bacterium]